MIVWLRDPNQEGNPSIASGLAELCEYLSNRGVMYEIGSFAGESSEIFSRYFKIVHCVDPWSETVEQITGDSTNGYTTADVEASFDERARLAGNIIKHKGRSLDVVVGVENESLDFVYIDANHTLSFAMADMQSWWPKVKRGGFLGGHDYIIPDRPGSEVAGAFRIVFGMNGPDVVFPDTSWVLRKP